MERGDISNEPLNRLIYVVWEGMIAVPQEGFTQRRFKMRTRYLSERRALDMYETNDACVEQLWALWGNDQPVAILTYLDERYHRPLRERLQAEDIPFARYMPTTAAEMAHTAAIDRQCLRLVDPEPLRIGFYGVKGCYLRPDNAKMIGRLS